MHSWQYYRACEVHFHYVWHWYFNEIKLHMIICSPFVLVTKSELSIKQCTIGMVVRAEHLVICYNAALPFRGLDNAADGSEGKKIPKEALSSGMY